jgi:hypothetical protein
MNVITVSWKNIRTKVFHVAHKMAKINPSTIVKIQLMCTKILASTWVTYFSLPTPASVQSIIQLVK